MIEWGELRARKFLGAAVASQGSNGITGQDLNFFAGLRPSRIFAVLNALANSVSAVSSASYWGGTALIHYVVC